jgi:manganese transport protein
MSNAMAVLLQTLSARLGIVNRRDLAQPAGNLSEGGQRLLWFLCEIAIAACDLAEILAPPSDLNCCSRSSASSACSLLPRIHCSFCGFRVSAYASSSHRARLITVIAACFGVEIWLVKPGVAEVAVPDSTPDPESLYVAIGIQGATVMPHNLYLHSALVSPPYGKTYDEKRRACRYNLRGLGNCADGALLINAAILILAATAFFKRGIVVTQIAQAHLLLAPLARHRAWPAG